eukprot:6140794-Amphidinium_carterae.1
MRTSDATANDNIRRQRMKTADATANDNIRRHASAHKQLHASKLANNSQTYMHVRRTVYPHPFCSATGSRKNASVRDGACVTGYPPAHLKCLACAAL